MIKYFKLSIFVVLLLVSCQFALASSVDVSLSEEKQLTFLFSHDTDGWQSVNLEIHGKSEELVYTFNDFISFKDGSSIQIVDCPKCSPGIYEVTGLINETSISSSFVVKTQGFDWFWTIIIVLALSLSVFSLIYFHPHSHKKTYGDDSKPKK